MKAAYQQIRQQKNCSKCRHAISSVDEVYCGKLRKAVDPVEACEVFELEPVEYTAYRRM